MAYKKIKSRESVKSITFIAAFGAILYLALFKTSQIRNFATEGLKLCASYILPTLFPFMIFPEIILALSDCKAIFWLGKSFERISGFCKEGVVPFLCGTICGFPIGAILVNRLYEEGLIEGEDLTKLICTCTTPSVAFCVGIGGSLSGEVSVGILFWISTVASALICGMVCSKSEKNMNFTQYKIGQKFDFVASVKRASSSAIHVTAFVTLFSVLLGLVKTISESEIIYLIFALFSEVGNSCSAIASGMILPNFAKRILISFALGFSGFSVFFQVASASPHGVFKAKSYLVIKLIQGILSAAFIAVITALFDK